MNHGFDIGNASKYGLHEAILIENFEFWIAKNVSNKRHKYDGRTWTYNSVKAFAELFPYLSTNSIRRAIEKLVSVGVLLTGNYNESSYDRTTWYSFSDSFKPQIHLAKNTNGSGKFAKSLTNTDINTDNKEPVGFASFWSAYPKKIAKPAALLKFKSAKLKAGELESILKDIETRQQADDWTKESGKYIPNPATYLNQRRWEDVAATNTAYQSNGILAGAI